MLFFAVDAAHMVAIAEKTLGRKRTWTTRGIEIATASANDLTRRWLGSLHNNFGWDYHENNEFAKALEHFKLALKYYTEYGTPQQQSAARWTVARGQRSVKEYDSALATQLELLREVERRNQEDGYISKNSPNST